MINDDAGEWRDESDEKAARSPESSDRSACKQLPRTEQEVAAAIWVRGLATEASATDVST